MKNEIIVASEGSLSVGYGVLTGERWQCYFADTRHNIDTILTRMREENSWIQVIRQTLFPLNTSCKGSPPEIFS
ncbi:MAG: hypothetical protein M0O96_00775 [Desulforhopalus sp.]|nr:hypothetical protein [Desulforhopalus sp.]